MYNALHLYCQLYISVAAFCIIPCGSGIVPSIHYLSCQASSLRCYSKNPEPFFLAKMICPCAEQKPEFCRLLHQKWLSQYK